MSQPVSDPSLSLDPPEQAVQFAQINLIQEYIPTPELTVQLEIEQLVSAVTDRVQNTDKSEATSAFAQIYGEIRREAYAKFNQIIQVYAKNKRNQYIILFYKDIDLKFEQAFSERLPLKETYRKEISNRKSRTVARKGENLGESEMIIKLLNLEIMELVLDWHVLVDQVVDGFARCHLYEVISRNSFKELYNNINSNYSKKETKALEPSILWRLKNVFRRGGKPEEKDVNAIDFKNLQNLVSRMACQEIIVGYLGDSQCQKNNKALIKMKGYMTLLTQSLDSIRKNINGLIEETLASHACESRHDYLEDFENIVDQLIELEGNLTLFDRGYLKSYFKEEARKTSVSEDIQLESNEQEC